MTLHIIENARRRLRTEYLVTPDLLLTPGEAAELLQLDRPVAVAALQALEASRFLELTPEGRFGRTPDRQGLASKVPSTAHRPAA